jgi:hypothetical protein
MFCGTRAGRYSLSWVATKSWPLLERSLGVEPSRAEIEANLRVESDHTAEQTHRALARYYATATGSMRKLFDEAGMDPDHGLIGIGRASNGFVISSHVFELDGSGRSYRLRPNTHSVWLRQITLLGGPFGLFLVRDTPEVRAAAREAGAIVDEPSKQMTNSWGLRGPEPDLRASKRGICLGDSFMLGMFNGDNDTPPIQLERALAELWKTPVCILNTGHIGYAPKQYYFSLKEYGDRFKPQFVVVSVCPNDFGDGDEVMSGAGDDWEEAEYWLDQIGQWCRTRDVECVLVAVPVDRQVETVRQAANYPGRVSNVFRGTSIYYCDPLDQFVDEHLRLVRDADKNGKFITKCPLYNGHINDNHFSPAGARLWAEIVARRVDLLLTRHKKPGPPPK